MRQRHCHPSVWYQSGLFGISSVIALRCCFHFSVFPHFDFTSRQHTNLCAWNLHAKYRVDSHIAKANFRVIFCSQQNRTFSFYLRFAPSLPSSCSKSRQTHSQSTRNPFRITVNGNAFYRKRITCAQCTCFTTWKVFITFWSLSFSLDRLLPCRFLNFFLIQIRSTRKRFGVGKNVKIVCRVVVQCLQRSFSVNEHIEMMSSKRMQILRFRLLLFVIRWEEKVHLRCSRN